MFYNTESLLREKRRGDCPEKYEFRGWNFAASPALKAPFQALPMKKVDFNDGKITKDIFKTALPMLAAQVLNLLYSIVDRMYIGRIPDTGTEALAAVGLCFPIIVLITGFTNMFGMGGSPLFSMALGRGDKKEAGEIQNTSFRLLILTAACIIIIGEIFAAPILTLFGASQEELPMAVSYLRIYLIGTFFIMTATGMNNFINAQGYSIDGMISVGIGACANLILDPIFIFVFGWGIQGAAAATVISQCLSMVYVLCFLFGKKNEFKISWAWKFPHAKNITVLGISPFIMQATNSLVQIVCNNVLMNVGGSLYVSVMTIVSSVRSILDVPVMAVTEGASPTLSFNYGARRPDNVRKAIKVLMAAAFPYTAIVWLLVMLVPEIFVKIFSTDTEILSDAVRALHIYFFAFIFQSFQYCGQTVFKALGKKKKAIFFSLFRKVILVVPLTILLPRLFGLGTDGVFMAEPISNVVGGLACFITMLCTVLPELKQMERENQKKNKGDLQTRQEDQLRAGTS